jgi:tetratricopeptide (TPR) repeat protein
VTIAVLAPVRARLFLSTLGLAALVATSACGDPPPVAAAALGAALELAAGEVALVDDQGEVTRRLLSGTPLPVDARLRTGTGARALVRLGDGTRLFLRDDTLVQLGDALELEAGHVWLDAPPVEAGQQPRGHTIGEATVSLSEGGASLSLVDGEAAVYVAEGLAVVTSPGGRAEVAAGERGVVSGGTAPVVEPVKFWEDWTGGMGDRSAVSPSGRAGSGALYAVDREAPPGSPALPLSVQRQNVRIVVEDRLAETLVDQRFFNPSGSQVEGWYWFSIPEGAQLVSFALETDGQLVEGEVVERQQAAGTYEAAVTRQRDPALLEWVDSHTVRARIWPVPALGERRIVVRYQQLLSETEGRLRYRYPLAGPPGKEAPSIEEFALEVELRGELADEFTVSSLTEARIEGDGARVTMRRSGYVPRADFELELTRARDDEHPPLRLNEVDPGADQARFVMVRYVPDLDFDAVENPRGDVVVVVDTSAAGDPSEHQTKLAVAEALLRSLSEGDRFALMSADVHARVLYPKAELSPATPEAISEALERIATHGTGGATDLGAIFESALERVHGLEQPAVVYVGDGLATSGERDGDALAERLRRSITGSRARLFTVGVGADVDEALLVQLARVGGGESLRVQLPEEAIVRALQLSGALKTPTITDLEVDVGEGLDDVFTSAAGKLSRGQELVLLARTHHDLPERITVRGRLAGEDFEREYEIERDQRIVDQMVPRLWAAAYVERLLGDARGIEAVRGKILSLGLEYGLMTPFTSFLALDSEAAYAQAGIQRRARRFPGPRLIADAAAFASPAAPTVLTSVLAAAAAPFGCSLGDRGEDVGAQRAPAKADGRAAEPTAGPAPATDAASATRQRGEEGKMGGAPAGNLQFHAGSENMAEEAEEQAGAIGGLLARGTVTESGDSDDGLRAGGDKNDESSLTPSEIEDEYDRWARERGLDPVALRDVGRETLSIPLARPSRDEVHRRRNKPVAPISPIARHRALPCSDAAQRSLAQRRVLWTQRLARHEAMEWWLDVYEASAAACEIHGWKDQRVFLQLLQERVRTEHAAQLLLAHFVDEPDARRYLAQALLRRLVDPALVAAVENALYGDTVDWWEVDHRVALETDPQKQLEILQQAQARAPGDPAGERRMIAFLVRQGRIDDAVARGRRLREGGQLTPALVQQLGDVFIAHGDREAAQRVFSEIVEFDPHSPASRRWLGDIFLRHGWYEEAYAQYEDLVGLAPEDATAAIRLARAAAGAGRVDEASRILRKVSAGEGRPGANDPRRWARLLAAVELAQLLDAKGESEGAIARELKRLQLFDGPAQWVLLTWEDLDATLVLTEDPPAGEEREPGTPRPLADGVDAAPVGLFAVAAPPGGLPPVRVRHRGPWLDRTVAHRTTTLTFDGTRFEVRIENARLAAVPGAQGEPSAPPP